MGNWSPNIAKLKPVLKFYILAKPIDKTPKQPKTLEKLKEINFKNFDFIYQSSKDSSVKQINLTIKDGKTVAFVGPSGSGKTTLIKLLVGLYQPTQGKIYYNQIEHNQLNFSQLRKRISLVTQETQLFAGTIKENLTFANPHASDDDCLEAMRAAAVENILTRDTKGLEAKIGEGGLKLSGGAKQRLAIARALLRKPEILIFDEATSNLDTITENAITKTIKEIEQKNPDLIKILVAHRLTTIMHADKIYLIQHGKIVDQGNHLELLKIIFCINLYGNNNIYKISSITF